MVRGVEVVTIVITVIVHLTTLWPITALDKPGLGLVPLDR